MCIAKGVAINRACKENSDCISGFCRGGACVDKGLVFNGACKKGSVCISKNCKNGTCNKSLKNYFIKKN